ncbi:MAG: DUF5926 family protein [Candidatus Nanopelagicales bacterium]
MARKQASRRNGSTSAAEIVLDGEIPVVGMREPCPCGSGRRYKACHGRVEEIVETTRPFEGFASECDLVCLRELVPSATAPLTLRAGIGGEAKRSVVLATVLPLAYPALVRANGEILLGLQVNTSTGNASRDLALALQAALETEPGNAVAAPRDATSPLRLQDLVEAAAPLDITVHEGFEFWADADEMTDEVRESLSRANAHANPSARLTSVPAAYWTQMGEKEHLRWAMSIDEELLLNALARLEAAGEATLGAKTKLVGMFRAQGIIVPVWDLPLGFGAAACEAPAAAFLERLNAALADSMSLTDAERRARSVLTTRQVTLR